MTDNDLCPRCNSNSEDLDHLFRRCEKSKEIWGYTLKSRLWRVRDEIPLSDWISFHLKSKKEIKLNTDGCCLAGT
ncbi:hypothetical protein RHGRI_019428 [Rhododendron griersonianum]|uniref:Reverse transcriptase zinc-binding domain-containing protein n=1 Tax=Rhododendron griersonianum TaxID=479676 RepID=A0AAV6JJZ0_9ERIC|nr:hypothetical protein RHGRI_019428 [Rhododendron griersonianum]